MNLVIYFARRQTNVLNNLLSFPHRSYLLLAVFICLPSLPVFLNPLYISYFSSPFPLYQSPSPPPVLPSTCIPVEGEFRKRGNPRGSQAPHRWLANYTFITSPLPPFLWPVLHNDSLFLWHLTSSVSS